MRLETWTYDKASPPRQELVLVDNDRVIARLECDFVGDNPYTVPKDQAEKHGALFQAAPDLLAALQQILPHYEDYFKNDTASEKIDTKWAAYTQARAAIAKATGESC